MHQVGFHYKDYQDARSARQKISVIYPVLWQMIDSISVRGDMGY
jgi:hypothetical protein